MISTDHILQIMDIQDQPKKTNSSNRSQKKEEKWKEENKENRRTKERIFLMERPTSTKPDLGGGDPYLSQGQSLEKLKIRPRS